MARMSTGIHAPMARFARSFAEAVIATVFPPVCHGCGIIMSRHGGLCAGCWTEVRFIERPFCEVTGQPFDHDRGDGLVSAAAIADPPVYDKARAVALYDGPARKLVQALKFSDRADLAPMMAEWMVRAGREVLDGSDVILAVPLHRRRLFGRAYNQAGELARAVSHISGTPLAPGTLIRRKATNPQVGLGRTARIANLSGAFRVEPSRASAIAGRRVLLIDDVLTTGATVNAAAKVLLRAGAARVCVLTFARVASGGAETLYA
ncbi:ComF family protein [Pseudohoeflea suaedae]|nr:ComF family protein [Pseudohoeflea suaedae]